MSPGKIRALTLALGGLLFPAASSAIVNIEGLRAKGSDDGFSSRVNISVSGSTGNAEKVDAGLGSRLQWRYGPRKELAILDYRYGESQGRRNANKTFLHGRHTQAVTDRYGWEGFAQVEQNEFARLKFRGLVGGGLRISLAQDQPDRDDSAGLGLFRSVEILEDSGLSDDRRELLWRANFYLALSHDLNTHARLTSTTYYQPDIADAGDFRLLEQAALEIGITEHIGVKLAVDISHDSDPPLQVDGTDIFYSTGLELIY